MRETDRDVIDNPLYLFKGVGRMAYERTVDFMGEFLFPRHSLHAQQRNQKKSITPDIRRIAQSNDDIIEFVTKEMSNTLENIHDFESN
jgi:hypothetical protein